MEPQNSSPNAPTDAAFANIHVINMEVAMELLGQEIAKLSVAIEHEQATTNRVRRRKSLWEERSDLRRRQQGLRSNDVAAVQAVFDQYGRGRK